ncbi:MAG: ABC transporter permease [Dehalococcoidia bacterium]|nr:ABC transporter permease [Dehalococcoidia bacterium]
MNILDILRTTFGELKGNKLRTGLTLLGIIIGVTAVIALMSIGRGAQQLVTANIASLGTNLLFVRPGSTVEAGVRGGLGTAATLTMEDAYALLDPARSPSIEAVAPELQTTAQVVAGRLNTRTRIIGVTPEYQNVRNYTIASGQFISPAHVQNSSLVAVLGSNVAATLFGLRDPTGQSIRITGRPYTVIGVLQSKGGGALGLQDDQVLVPLTTAFYRLTSQRTAEGLVTVQAINVQVRDSKEMDSAVQEIAGVLRLRHRITADDDFTIASQQETIQTLEETTGVFVWFLGAIAGISLLVGGIGIMNIMLVSVTERTREIGIRKAVGARRIHILVQFLAEATCLSVAGGGMGMLFGWLASRLLQGMSLGTQTFHTVFNGDIALTAVLVSIGIGLFFGVYPAARASRLHPIEALRYE